MTPYRQFVLLTGALVAKGFPPHRRHGECMRTASRHRQNMLHHPSPGFAVWGRFAEASVDQQVRQLVGDDFIDECLLIFLQQHGVNPNFPILQPGASGGGAALVIGDNGFGVVAVESGIGQRQLFSQAAHYRLMECDRDAFILHGVKHTVTGARL